MRRSPSRTVNGWQRTFLGAVPHLLDDAGHITLVNDLEEVLRELLQLK